MYDWPEHPYTSKRLLSKLESSSVLPSPLCFHKAWAAGCCSLSNLRILADMTGTVLCVALTEQN
ncbi:hypothetical protein BD408DRAFT_420636 [Parasitella parasitica]|nr:hypothetical protein BD408DRAFT_420636 [Parasitella parasitica]